jgi:DNA-binding XRE family transcriptional regulator
MQAGGLITFVKKQEEQPLLSTLGDRVKWVRAKRKLSQAALGKAAGVSQGTIGNIEAGIRDRPRELLAIAAALKANPGWLESGKGSWDAGHAAPRSMFEELTDEEKRLLDNFRAMLDEDQKSIAEDIASRAARMRAYTAKVLERVGASARPAKSAADAKKTKVARAALDVTDRLRQQSFTEDPGEN